MRCCLNQNNKKRPLKIHTCCKGPERSCAETRVVSAAELVRQTLLENVVASLGVLCEQLREV